MVHPVVIQPYCRPLTDIFFLLYFRLQTHSLLIIIWKQCPFLRIIVLFL
jgi:hypothetical protein